MVGVMIAIWFYLEITASYHLCFLYKYSDYLDETHINFLTPLSCEVDGLDFATVVEQFFMFDIDKRIEERRWADQRVLLVKYLGALNADSECNLRDLLNIISLVTRLVLPSF